MRRGPRLMLVTLLAVASTAPLGVIASVGVAVAAATSGGCSAAAVSAAPVSGTATLMVPIGGVTRTVLMHVPSGYDGSTALPLVLNVHGSGSTAAEQEAFSGMNATSDANGFIVAYPQANIPATTGFDWNVPREPLLGGAPVPKGAANDVAFLTKLVPALQARYCIDQKRVFATGFSGGGRMASQLGCDASTLIAAVAPVSGLRLPSPCDARRPVPVIAFQGTADPVDPYAGNGQKYWTYSVPDAAKRWSTHDGCAAKPVTSVPGAGADVTTYAGCRGGAQVRLYALAGEGHEWPGGPQLAKRITNVLGPQTNAVDANSLMWSFFAAHPLP